MLLTPTFSFPLPLPCSKGMDVECSETGIKVECVVVILMNDGVGEKTDFKREAMKAGGWKGLEWSGVEWNELNWIGLERKWNVYVYVYV